MREWIYGRNPIYETLRASRRQFFRLRCAQGIQERGRLEDILNLCRQKRIPVETIHRSWLDELSPGHQGVALEVSGYPVVTLDDLLTRASQRSEPPFLLILDTLQDPQNLGTLLRTAESVGVHGVLLPYRRTATVIPAVVNSSAGASEHLLIAQTNLAQAIEALKTEGVWVIGLEAGPQAQSLKSIDLKGPLALVVGNEGEGMRPLVRKSCDLLLSLPMRGRIESLNAAVAGSIALYLAWQAREYIIK